MNFVLNEGLQYVHKSVGSMYLRTEEGVLDAGTGMRLVFGRILWKEIMKTSTLGMG